VSSMLLKKLAVNVDEVLIDKIDMYAKSMHINRTSAVSVLLAQALDVKENMETLSTKILLKNIENNLKSFDIN